MSVQAVTAVDEKMTVACLQANWSDPKEQVEAIQPYISMEGQRDLGGIIADVMGYAPVVLPAQLRDKAFTYLGCLQRYYATFQLDLEAADTPGMVNLKVITGSMAFCHHIHCNYVPTIPFRAWCAAKQLDFQSATEEDMNEFVKDGLGRVEQMLIALKARHLCFNFPSSPVNCQTH